MALHIEHPEAERLARQLAAKTGETLTDVVLECVARAAVSREARRRPPPLRRELEAIRKRCSALPVLDPRPADEILGYDEHGLPW